MADSKLEIKVGSITFSGEGTGEWLSKQLDKLLEKLPELVAISPTDPPSNGGDGKNQNGNSAGAVSGPLASFLKSADASTNQVKKFLATALWLHDTKNKDRLTTADVTAALRASSQSRLTNASDCLNQNVGKGYCEKDGKEFFVTTDGRASLKQ